MTISTPRAVNSASEKLICDPSVKMIVADSSNWLNVKPDIWGMTGSSNYLAPECTMYSIGATYSIKLAAGSYSQM